MHRPVLDEPVQVEKARAPSRAASSAPITAVQNACFAPAAHQRRAEETVMMQPVDDMPHRHPAIARRDRQRQQPDQPRARPTPRSAAARRGTRQMAHARHDEPAFGEGVGLGGIGGEIVPRRADPLVRIGRARRSPRAGAARRRAGAADRTKGRRERRLATCPVAPVACINNPVAVTRSSSSLGARALTSGNPNAAPATRLWRRRDLHASCTTAG